MPHTLARRPPKQTAARAGRRVSVPETALGELSEQRPRFGLLLIVAFVQDFLQDLASTFHVAHFLVRLGEVELGRSVVPLTVEHGRSRVLEGRALRIEGEVELVELNRSRRASELRCWNAAFHRHRRLRLRLLRRRSCLCGRRKWHLRLFELEIKIEFGYRFGLERNRFTNGRGLFTALALCQGRSASSRSSGRRRALNGFPHAAARLGDLLLSAGQDSCRSLGCGSRGWRQRNVLIEAEIKRRSGLRFGLELWRNRKHLSVGSCSCLFRRRRCWRGRRCG